MAYFGLDYFITAHQRVYLPYLMSALLIACVYVKRNPDQSGKLYSKTVWRHPSAQLDYYYFAVVSFIKMMVILPLILSSKDVSLWVVLQLQDSLGYMQSLQAEKSSVVVLYTLALFIAGDFTRYWLHRALHTVPLLWEFHKVHHSAETLTPVTFYRVHPVENILFGLRYALSAGAVTGVFIYLFGANIGHIQVLGANLFVFLSGIAGANLRHSHIPIRYGDKVEKILISPYQHQLHHTKTLNHKNFGGVLALWDTLFKTLHVEKVRDLEFGLKGPQQHHTVGELLLLPFIEIAKKTHTSKHIKEWQ